MNAAVVRQLRDIVPIRPLTRLEALMVAERQSLRLLSAAGVTAPPVSTELISQLPRVEVKRVTPFPTSGATQWTSGRWLVIINGAEPLTRQRFSLAHEFKHILDHPFVGSLYGALDVRDRQQWIEQVCDFFAGCLLMPRPWLKREWAAEQHVGSLAGRFHVSQAAMTTRLRQIGLGSPYRRCNSTAATAVRSVTEIDQLRPFYERSAAPSSAVLIPTRNWPELAGAIGGLR